MLLVMFDMLYCLLQLKNKRDCCRCHVDVDVVADVDNDDDEEKKNEMNTMK